MKICKIQDGFVENTRVRLSQTTKMCPTLSNMGLYFNLRTAKHHLRAADGDCTAKLNTYENQIFFDQGTSTARQVRAMVRKR